MNQHSALIREGQTLTAQTKSFDGKPKASMFPRTIAYGLPLNELFLEDF